MERNSGATAIQILQNTAGLDGKVSGQVIAALIAAGI